MRHLRKKFTPKPFVLIALFLVILILSSNSKEKLRSSAQFFSGWFTRSSTALSLEEEIEELKLQNQQLREQLKDVSELQEFAPNAVAARVVHRSAALWSSILWINVGAGQIEVNSPVTKGDAVVGVVEYVGPKRSRVRLLTDTKLIPSVRVLRDGQYLAKGEVHGAGEPHFRRRSPFLEGVGFNYDFDDEEGPAIDLRSQNPSIIKEGDLLVTAGFDGVFPKDLEIGTVKKLHLLREGDYTFRADVEPAVDNFDELSLVFVLSPL